MLRVDSETIGGQEFVSKSSKSFFLDEEQIERMNKYQSQLSQYIMNKESVEKFKEIDGEIVKIEISMYQNLSCCLFDETKTIQRFINKCQ